MSIWSCLISGVCLVAGVKVTSYIKKTTCFDVVDFIGCALVYALCMFVFMQGLSV